MLALADPIDRPRAGRVEWHHPAQHDRALRPSSSSASASSSEAPSPSLAADALARYLELRRRVLARHDASLGPDWSWSWRRPRADGDGGNMVSIEAKGMRAGINAVAPVAADRKSVV